MTNNSQPENLAALPSPSPTGPSPDLHKIYEAMWRNMERENNLINYRNQWSIVLSGGILATQGVLLTALREIDKNAVDYFFSGGILMVMFLLSALAIFFCTKTNEGVQAAQNQLEYLRRHYDSFESDIKCPGNFFELKLRYPRPFGDPHDHNKGNIAALSFPKVMLVIWVVFALLEGSAASIFIADGIRGVSHNPSEAAPKDNSSGGKKARVKN
ncbi:hypothetical protein [Methylosinus sp. LW4]|uniref:hypothetical protein n=1 Tax=Methylosinus sp. LW4 TaxID=136993 RepID=UPI0018DED15C|nr:hypothetical protein [Methylosinus sp. LW4]